LPISLATGVRRNITRLGDVYDSSAATVVGVLIQIWQDEAQPLSGRVARDGQEPKQFAGWLQLLSILSDWLAPERMPPSDLPAER
jgi:hypothetical protein